MPELTELQGMMVDTLIRKNKASIMRMTEDERNLKIDEVTKTVQGSSDFELMSYMSENEKEVPEELKARIASLQEKEAVAQPLVAAHGGQTSFGAKAEKLQRRADLLKAGASLDEDLPAGSLEMGFGVNPAKSLQKSLSEHFKQDVFVTEKDGELFYFNPKERKLKLANPNMAGVIGHSLPITGDIAGTIGMGVATRRLPVKTQFAAEVGGSGIGTGLGEFTRLSIGRLMGVHDLTLTQMAAKSGYEGLKAGGATGVLGGLMSSFKALQNWHQGNIFSREEALKAGMNAEEAEAAVSEVNKLLGGKGEVKLTTGRMSDDVNIQSDEAAVRELGEFKQGFVERDISDQEALTKALDVVAKPTTREGGEAVRDIAAKQVAKRTGQAKEALESRQANLETELEKLSATPEGAVGQPTREIIIKKSEAAKQAQAGEWAAMKEKHGFSSESETFGIDIPRGEAASKIAKISERRAKTAQIAGVKSSEKKGLVLKPKMADLEDYNHNLSVLRADIRSANAGRKAGDATVAEMKKMEQALIGDRRVALVKAGKADLLKDIESAEKATADYYKTYRRSVIGDLTAKNDNGVFKIADKDFVKKMMKGSPEEMDDMLTVIGDSPELMNAWKEGVIDTYKQKAFTGNKFNSAKSKEFIKENKLMLSKLMTDKEIADLATTGDLALKLEKQIGIYKKTLLAADKKWGRGKLKSMDPRDVMEFITTKKGSFITPTEEGVSHQISKMKYIKNILKPHPAAWKKVQEDYSTTLRDKAFNAKDGAINPNKISDLVEKESEEIIEMMGKPYYDDLVKINKVVQIASKKLGKVTTSENRNLINSILRMTVAPPLSKEGRGLTALNIWQRKETHKVIAKAFMDRETISKVAKLAEHNTFNRESVELAASLGIIGEEE